MALILPPAVKTLSADNVTGANMSPDSDCREFILQDTADNPSLDSTVTINGKTITRQPGFRWVFKCVTGSYFPNNVSIGTIKAGSTGTSAVAVGFTQNASNDWSCISTAWKASGAATKTCTLSLYGRGAMLNKSGDLLMKKIINTLSFFLFILFTGVAWGQTSSVSATITDSTGQAYANGTYDILFRPFPGAPGTLSVSGSPFTQHFSGVLDATGAFAVTLTRTDFVQPSGGQWTFTICPLAASACFTSNQPITAASVNLTTALHTITPIISVFSLGNIPAAYSSSEIVVTPNPGSFFWNLTTGTFNFWNGSSWTAMIVPTSNITFTGADIFTNSITGSGDNPLVWGGSVTGKNFEFYPSAQTVPFAGLLAGNSAAVTGIFIGDSITAGTGPPSNANSWAMQVASRLQQFYGNAGNGFCDGGGGGPTGCFPVLAGAWTGAQTGPFQIVSPAFNDVQRGTSSATATIPNIVGQASVDVIYYTFTDSAGFDIKLDGVSQGTFGASTSAGFVVQKVTISGILADGSSHTILITAPSSGAMYLLGVMEHTGVKGFQMWNTAQPGASSGAFASANQLNWLSIVPNPAFALVALGQNDYSTLTTAQLVANHQTIYNQLKLLNIPEVLLITEPPQSSDSCVVSPCPIDFVKAEIAWAQSLNIPIVDIFARWGTYAAGNTLGFYADAIHPSQTGANDITYAVMQRLFPAITPNVARGEYYPMQTGQESIGFHFGTANAAVTPYVLDGPNNPTIKVNQTAGAHTTGSGQIGILNNGFTNIAASLGWMLSDATGNTVLFRNGAMWIAGGGSFNVPCATFEIGATCQFKVDAATGNTVAAGTLQGGGGLALTSTSFNAVYEAGTVTNDKIYTNTQALAAGAATHTLANSFTYTSSATFGCSCTDQTAANACKAVPASATTLTLVGTGSDVLWLSCSGH